MTKQTEAMKLALEALEVATTPFARDRQEVLRAQAALREALADQPAQPQQEPETCANCKHNEWPFGVCDGCPKQSDESQTGNWEPEDKQPDYKALYERAAKQYNELAALMEPPAQRKPWVGLTEQEAAECWSTSTVRTWQAIEAKLREKNNG